MTYLSELSVAVAVAVGTAALEEEYWLCERLAQSTKLSQNEMQYCSLITERFKQQRFNGENQPFWDYYKKNKQERLRPQIPRAGRGERGHHG